VKGCTVYPQIYLSEQCKLCNLFEQCIFREKLIMVKLCCQDCGYSVELKKSYVECEFVMCPICKSVIESN
jgi:hypothetical protein